MAIDGTLSLRETLEEAFDEDEKGQGDEGEQEQKQELEVVDDVDVEVEGEAKDDSDAGDATDGDDAEAAKAGEDEAGDTEEGDKEPDEDKEGKRAADAIKVPNGWRAGAKEVWGKIPAAAQKEIQRRENDMGRVLNESAEHRKTAEGFTQAIQPFLPNIQAEGVTPQVAIQNLLQTAASLQMGSALVKAQTITRLIGAYGVDIQTLSDVLTDKYQPTEEDRVNQAVDARMAPYNNQQQQMNQQRQYEENKSRELVKVETDAWSEKAEFIKDVGADMADLLDMAGNRGQALTLDEAYDKACMMNPEIRKIIAQREAAANAKNTNRNSRKKRKAASSIHGATAGKPGAMQDTSLRGALEAAWDGAEVQ